MTLLTLPTDNTNKWLLQRTTKTSFRLFRKVSIFETKKITELEMGENIYFEANLCKVLNGTKKDLEGRLNYKEKRLSQLINQEKL